MERIIKQDMTIYKTVLPKLIKWSNIFLGRLGWQFSVTNYLSKIHIHNYVFHML